MWYALLTNKFLLIDYCFTYNYNKQVCAAVVKRWLQAAL
jgi:hypothetical protein